MNENEIRREWDRLEQERASSQTVLEEAEVLRGMVSLARRSRDRAMLLEVLTEYGGVIKYLGRYQEAEEAFLEVQSILREVSECDGQAYVNCLANLAGLDRMMGRYESAEARFQEAIAGCREDCDRESRASLKNNLALLYQEQGRFQEALQLHRENLDPASAGRRPAYQTGSTYNNIAVLCIRTGQYEEAAKAAGRALECYRALEPDDALRLTAMNTLATAQYCSGQAAEALRIFQEIRPRILAAYGGDSPNYKSVVRSIGRIRDQLACPEDER